MSIPSYTFVSFNEMQNQPSTAVLENSQTSVNGTPVREALLHTAVLHTTLFTEATAMQAP